MRRPRPERCWAALVAAAAFGIPGCAGGGGAGAPEAPVPAEEAPPPGDRAWSAPGFHIAGSVPEGWERVPVDEPGLVALEREESSIDLRVLVLDAASSRPDPELLQRLAPAGWTHLSGCTFDILGVAGVRADFRSGSGMESTQLLWEWHEGARPGRKFLFHAVLVCPAALVESRRRDFEVFISSLAADLEGPATDPARRTLDAGWQVVTDPRRRSLSLSGFAVPSPTDPFVVRDVPVGACMDLAEEGRKRQAAGEALTSEDLRNEAAAHYTVALHQLWSQVGAPEERREGQRISPRESMELSARMHSVLTINLSLRLKLAAMRDGSSWRTVERLKQNASALEALCQWFRDGVMTDEIRRDLEAVAAAPVGDYRELSFAASRGLDPAAASSAAAAVRRGREALRAGRLEEAEEAGREAIGVTEGAWADGWRLVAAAQFAQGRLEGAAGAARSAAAALPGAADILLEEAEIFIAAGRADAALGILEAGDALIRDSLPDCALIHACLTISAYLRDGRTGEARDAAEALARRWVEATPAVPEWDFSLFETSIPDRAPWKSRQLALHGLLRHEITLQAFRRAWELE